MKFSMVHHISINVDDSDKVKAFYLNNLGFEEIERPDFDFSGAWLQMGDQQLHLIQVDNHQAPAGQHFAFRVDDIGKARDYLINNGIEVSEPSELAGVCAQCFFKDPAGNLLELNQPF